MTSTMLSALSDTECAVKCDIGYSGGSGTYTCPISGGTASTSLTCTENTCSAIGSFGTGVVGGDSDACTTSTTLSAVSDASCAVKCDTGYSGGSGTYTCSTSGGTASTSLTCTALCSESVPDGYCPTGQECDAGTCKAAPTAP